MAPMEGAVLADAARMTANRPAMIGIGVVAGLTVACLVGVLAVGRGEARVAPGSVPAMAATTTPLAASPDGPALDALLARLGRLEVALGSLADATQRAEEAAQAAAAGSSRTEARVRDVERLVAERGPQGDRFLAAALLLQASITTPRPWLREYQAMAELAPPEALSRMAAEVLASHAARGLPSEAELRERFVAMMPQLQARAPRQGDTLDHTVAIVRGGFASIGLTAPPPPTDQEQAIAGVVRQLRRGNLAGAVADAAALDTSLQPLLSGWLAQARARLSVEQAVQETLLRILAPTPGQPPPGQTHG